MTCNCTHGCKRDAEGSGPYPTLCDVCGLATALNSSKCGLPYTPTVWPKLDPEVPITDAQKDEAIQTFVAENGF